MKKVILATVLTAGVLATTAFAYNQGCPNAGQQGMMNSQQGMQQGMMGSAQGMQRQGGMMGGQNGMMNSQGMQQKGMMGVGRGRMGGHGGMMQMFSQLDLTSDQAFQLSVLRDEMRLSMKKLRGPNHQGEMMKFISVDGFDTKAFKEEMNKEHKEMLDSRAENMEKAFKILTKEQIQELKTKLAN